MNTKKRYNANWLIAGFLFALILPIAILTYTEKNPPMVAITAILLPLGFYSIFSALSRRLSTVCNASFKISLEKAI